MKPLVFIENLEFSYEKQPLLKKISLRVDPGEIIILTGPSGSGKTTLLTLIGTLRTAEKGILHVLGSSLIPHPPLALRQKIGYIFQHHNLIAGLTALQNVSLSLELIKSTTEASRHERSASLLQRVGLGSYLHSYPSTLSGGQKQRVAIARALVGYPSLVLADEPTASLDKNSAIEVMMIFQELAKEKNISVVMITHDPRLLPYAHRLIHLEEGIITEKSSLLASERIL